MSFTPLTSSALIRPGCVKSFIIPDIVLFVNGIPLVVMNKGRRCEYSQPMHAAFEQLLRYRNGRKETLAAGLREGEPRLFHSNVLVIRTCGEKSEFGTITFPGANICMLGTTSGRKVGTSLRSAVQRVREQTDNQGFSPRIPCWTCCGIAQCCVKQ